MVARSSIQLLVLASLTVLFTPACDEGPPPATAKFCNDLSSNQGSVLLGLEVGGRMLEADSGECTPCTPVPFGADVEVVLWDLDYDDWLSKGDMSLEAGGQYLFFTALDGGWPIVEGWALDADNPCSTLDF